MNFGLYGYAGATLAYSFFAILLIFSWRQSRRAQQLMVVMLLSALWAFFSVNLSYGNTGHVNWYGYWLFDAGRYIAWYVFLLKLFEPAVIGQSSKAVEKSTVELALKKSQLHNKKGSVWVKWSLPLTVSFAGLVFVNDVYSSGSSNLFGLIGHIFLALIAMVILEQVFRNLPIKSRWAIKYLIIGAGSIFVFDFYFYADGLLFHHLDATLWQARGFIHCAAIPLLAISAARSKNWSLNLFVSRDIVLSSTVIIGGGMYLLAISMAGYYLREFGGGWGKVGQVTLISLALILLVSILLSGQLRAKVRVFLGKHFYKNKYDYRIEWLKLTEELNISLRQVDNYSVVVRSIAQIIEARGGMLWLGKGNNQQEEYRNVASWQVPVMGDIESYDSAFIQYMESSRFVINIKEVNKNKDEYVGFVLPVWVGKLNNPWVVVPLFDAEQLSGFIVLTQPLVERSINWEDRDLLKTAARQVASYLKVLMTSAELAEAKQFEVFSRLSAYMVHDLKNIAAELELVAQNARRHSTNPDFVKDAFETVEHASLDIKRLLDQLRNRKVGVEKKIQLDLSALICDVVQSRQADKPSPVFTSECDECIVATESGRLRNVLAHLIENAQQATEEEGYVLVTLYQEKGMYIISIKDNGHGMDEDFIRDRLFKPFDTTKGNAGMGIGMYESMDFIQRSGGDISVQSKTGKGSIITLHLPAMNDFAMQTNGNN